MRQTLLDFIAKIGTPTIIAGVIGAGAGIYGSQLQVRQQQVEQDQALSLLETDKYGELKGITAAHGALIDGLKDERNALRSRIDEIGKAIDTLRNVSPTAARLLKIERDLKALEGEVATNNTSDQGTISASEVAALLIGKIPRSTAGAARLFRAGGPGWRTRQTGNSRPVGRQG
ncbi:MAG: hypothetical protein KDK00_09285 [Rhodobacteraceae bacterium]|nr:hypothetical protein [Paracoccaceae bacterium]